MYKKFQREKFSHFFREFTCDICKSDIQEIADLYRNQDAIDYYIGLFQGMYFGPNHLIRHPSKVPFMVPL